MNRPRPPDPPSPPHITGYTPIGHLGSGGYADVFLYEQRMPNRKVAIKVLHGGSIADTAKLRQFTDEANTLAQVSEHPYIVSIFGADVATDGRPYLAMEYYPGDNYLLRARNERFSIGDVLRIGIQVASAVETAHRAGILHRDIKPANILTSAYRRPGLADFGIAAAHDGDRGGADGISIPWSPPEALGGDSLQVESDVYSLAATLFHLLVGRSPFEVPGGDNSVLALVERIERQPVPVTGRPDVPGSLERLFERSMAKRAAHRPESAIAFARALQAVQAELQLDQTPLELPDHGRPARSRTAGPDVDATTPRFTEIDPERPRGVIDGIPAAAGGRPPVGASPSPTDRIVDTGGGHSPLPPASHTQHRDGLRGAILPSPSVVEPIAPRRRWVPFAIAGGLGAVVLAVVLAMAMTGGDSSSDTSSSEPPEPTTGEVFVQPVDAVTDLVGTVAADGSIVFTWRADDRQPGDTYLVQRLDGAGGAVDLGATSSTELPITGVATGVEVCIAVTASRVNAPLPPAVEGCVTP